MSLKFHFLFEAAFYIPLVPAVIAVVKWRAMQMPQRWFTVLLWATLLISFSSRIWILITEYKNNMPFFHCYILVEFLLLLMVFKHMFKQSMKDYIWWIIAVTFSVIWVINIFTGQGWWGFPDYVHAVEAVIILALIVKWFLKMLKEKTVARPAKTFEFWMCVGLLIFFTGNFLLFTFSKFISSSGSEVFKAIYVINGILNLLLYISYIIALLWVKKKVK